MISIGYFHHRMVVMMIIFIGGCVALWIVYEFLFAPAPHPDPLEEQVGTVMINKKALERVSHWRETMREQGTITISISNSVFAIPTPVPTQ